MYGASSGEIMRLANYRGERTRLESGDTIIYNSSDRSIAIERGGHNLRFARPSSLDCKLFFNEKLCPTSIVQVIELIAIAAGFSVSCKSQNGKTAGNLSL